jgi:protein-tyrosine-phosphatase
LTAKTKPKSAARREPRFRYILFICAANTARSVMAEHILRRELDALGFDHRITITSAGIAPYARDGALVSLDTRMALREVGIDIGDQATSTDLKRHPEMLAQTDLIIAMTEQQARELVERFPGAAGRPVFTLRSFAGEAGDIDDPYEKGDLVFAQCREEIHRLVPTIIERLFHR